MSKDTGLSRNLMLIKNGINYKRRQDLENTRTCNIWVEVDTSRNKRTLFMAGYRQWALPASLDKDKDRRCIGKQEQRFKLTLEKWSLAAKEKKDIVILTDDNIDTDDDADHN